MLRNNNLKILFCVLCITALFMLVVPYSPAAADSTAGWGIAELLEHNDQGNANDPKIVMNSEGDAMAVWTQFDGSVFNILSNRYVAGYGWEEAVVIEYNDVYDARFPNVAMNDNGDVIAVFQVGSGSWVNICANHYTKGQGWGNPQVIELNNSGDNNFPEVSMNNDGDAVAVWRSPGSPYSILASNYTKAGGWSPEELIESDPNNVEFYKVAMDGNGNAIAVMRIWDGSRYSLYANRFTKSVGWGSEVLIEDNDIHEALKPDLAIDNNGNAIVVWLYYDSSLAIYNVSWNRYEVGSGWGTFALLENYDVSTSNEPDIAVNALGDAVATWTQFESGQYNLYARRFTPSSGWDLPLRVGYSETGSVIDVDVTLSYNGDATVVWSQDDGSRWNIYANHSTINSGWGTTSLIETNNVKNAFDPDVASDANGNAIAAWVQSDGINLNIWANHFVAPDITPPSLDITNPISESIVDIPIVTVSGTSEYGVHLVVNGIVVNVEPDGSFEFQLALSEGSNVIFAKATDSSENSATDSITVTYERTDSELEKKLQEVWDDLNETEDNLNNTNNELDETLGSLNATVAELNATQKELENTKDDLTQTMNSLETTQKDLDSNWDELNKTKEDLTELNNDLKSTNDELESTQAELDTVKENLDVVASQLLLIPLGILVILVIIMVILYTNLIKKMGKLEPLPLESTEESTQPESIEDQEHTEKMNEEDNQLTDN